MSVLWMVARKLLQSMKPLARFCTVEWCMTPWTFPLGLGPVRPRAPLLSRFCRRLSVLGDCVLWASCRSEVPCRHWKVTGAFSGRQLSWPLTRARAVRGRLRRVSSIAAVLLGLERHRFRFRSAVHGRNHALSELDLVSALETVEELSRQCEWRCVADGSFEEISLPALRSTTWTGQAMDRFFYQAAIHLLEARAQMRGAVRCEKWYRMISVTLLDSMACTLALGRARARSFRLLLLVRRACAFGLLFIADSISAGFPRKETPLMLHRAFSVAEKSKTKARIVSITRISLSTLIRFCTMRRFIPHPTHVSHTFQDFQWLPLVRGFFQPKRPPS